MKKYFSQVSNHFLMVEWLDQEEYGGNYPSNLDVWGIKKSNYTFKNLIRYLEEAKEKSKVKGKKKVKVAHKRGGEKKGHKKAKKEAK